jgi:Dolichyl-phosphate-mannose-protein mannosyltransferase
MCAAATAVAFLLTWPIGGLGFSDDWSYAFTARNLAQTGHLTYNGWATAAIIPQAYWGAMVIKLFGFSFTALRISTLPFAMGSAAIAYLLGRRAGLGLGSALLASLTMALGPMFLPLATSFMSDVPGLMFMLLSLYALIRCGESESSGGRILWLGVGALAALLGGMDRQIVWLVPLAILPYLILVRPRSPGFLIAAAGAWIIVMLGAVATVGWFDAQPYSVPEPPTRIVVDLILREPGRLWETALALWLTTVMLTLPATLPGAMAGLRNILVHWKSPRGLVWGVVFLLIASFLLHFPRFLEMPWLGNMVTPAGVLGSVELIGHRPVVLPKWLREGIGGVAWIIAGVLASELVGSLPTTREAVKHLRDRLGRIGLAVPCIGICAAVYTMAVMSRTGRDLVFDRYTLPLVPLLGILMLRWWQKIIPPIRARRIIWAAAMVVLGIYTAYAIASTQEVLALGRARLEAMRLLEHAGVPGTHVMAGVEQMGWTQLESTGHLNNPEVLNSPEGYRADEGMMPGLKPDYLVEASCDPRAGAKLVRSVEYFSLLPPMERRIYIFRNVK